MCKKVLLSSKFIYFQCIKEWKYCKKLLNPFEKGDGEDRRGMLDRAVDLEDEVEKINPEIAAMCKEILDEFPIENIFHTAAEVASLYQWSRGILAQLEKKGKIATLPTDPPFEQTEKRIAWRQKKQREIFGIKK